MKIACMHKIKKKSDNVYTNMNKNMIQHIKQYVIIMCKVLIPAYHLIFFKNEKDAKMYQLLVHNSIDVITELQDFCFEKFEYSLNC